LIKVTKKKNLFRYQLENVSFHCSFNRESDSIKEEISGKQNMDDIQDEQLPLFMILGFHKHYLVNNLTITT